MIAIDDGVSYDSLSHWGIFPVDLSEPIEKNDLIPILQATIIQAACRHGLHGMKAAEQVMSVLTYYGWMTPSDIASRYTRRPQPEPRHILDEA